MFWLFGNSGIQICIYSNEPLIITFYKILIRSYIKNVIHFSVWPASSRNMYIGSILNIFAINTWVLPYQNFAPNEVAWTISTLFFWYWCFPLILPRLQRLTNIQLAERIVKYYWISVGLGISLHVALGGFRNHIGKVYIIHSL